MGMAPVICCLFGSWELWEGFVGASSQSPRIDRRRAIDRWGLIFSAFG